MNSELPPSMEFEANSLGVSDVGGILRASRLRKGEEVADVARALRIRAVYLQAIEDGRYNDLPGAVYAIGFIRSYAEHLGLDGEQVVLRFKSEASGQGRKPDLVFPTVIPENGIPRGAIVTVGALVLVAAYGGWYFLSTKDQFATDAVPPVPQSIVAAAENGTAASGGSSPRREPTAAVAAPVLGPISEPVRSSDLATEPPADGTAAEWTVAAAPERSADTAAADRSSEAATPTSEPSAVAPESEVGRAPVAPPVTQQPDETAAVSVAAAPEAPAVEDEEADRTPSPTINGEDGSQSASAPEQTPAAEPQQVASLPEAADSAAGEIMLRAVIDSWIQIRDTRENRLVLTRLLREGESYAVPDREGLTLVTGNAGGLEIVVNGQVVPSLGPLGTVRRNVVLDPERLRAGSAVAE